MKYHLHVFGCQMNEADAQRVGSELEKIGLTYTDHPRDADVIVLDTCVVRPTSRRPRCLPAIRPEAAPLAP